MESKIDTIEERYAIGEIDKPIYEKSAAYGHFGREPEGDGSFSWEKTDKKSVFSK